MHLNERLQICLLALANRHSLHAVDIDEEIVGPQSFRTTGWTALELIEQLQHSRPDLLQAQARIVLDAQHCGIYLIDLSEEQPAFHIHCWGRVLSPTTGELVNVPVEGCPEA